MISHLFRQHCFKRKLLVFLISLFEKQFRKNAKHFANLPWNCVQREREWESTKTEENLIIMQIDNRVRQVNWCQYVWRDREREKFKLVVFRFCSRRCVTYTLQHTQWYALYSSDRNHLVWYWNRNVELIFRVWNRVFFCFGGILNSFFYFILKLNHEHA